MADTPTDEQILADPGAYTVEQVTDVFARSEDDAIADAKALEADGKDRTGIAQWQRPQPAEPEQDTFDRDRVLGPEGPQIIGTINELGRAPQGYEIVGALHGDDTESFTRDELRTRITDFLSRPVPTEEA